MKKKTQNKKKMTRREFLITTGAATGAALVTASVGPFVHTTMAKGGTLKVCSYGGSYQESQRKALFQPFADKFGVKIIEASGPDIAKIKAQVDNKAYEWDVVDLETRHIARGELENLLEPIDTNVVNLEGIDKKAIRKAAIGNIFWTTSLAYNKKAIGDQNPPASWVDFWDVKNFPGPRALQDQAPFNLEFALLADGQLGLLQGGSEYAFGDLQALEAGQFDTLADDLAVLEDHHLDGLGPHIDSCGYHIIPPFVL